MGWLYGHDWDTSKKLKDAKRVDFIAAKLAVVDEATTAYGKRWWVLLKPTNADGTPAPSVIVLYLLEKADGIWGYKDMDEGMHPFYYDCPVRLLDKADAPMNATGAEWRAEVRKQGAAKAAKLATAKTLKKGDTVMLRAGVKPRGPFEIASLKPLRGYFGHVLYRLKPTDIETVTPKPVPCAYGKDAPA